MFTCHMPTFHIWIGLKLMDSLGRNSWIYERISACEMTKVVSAGRHRLAVASLQMLRCDQCLWGKKSHKIKA